MGKSALEKLQHFVPQVLFLSLFFGCFASLVNVSPTPVLRALSIISGAISTWCIVGFYCGRLANERALGGVATYLKGAIAGGIGLLFAVLAYYVTDLLRGVYTYDTVAWGIFQQDVSSWARIAVATGLIFGVFGAASKRRTLAGQFFSLSPLGVFVYDRRYGLTHLGEGGADVALIDVGSLLVILALTAWMVIESRGRRQGIKPTPQL